MEEGGEEEKKDLSDMPTLILGESAIGPTDVDIRKLFLQEVGTSYLLAISIHGELGCNNRF